VYKALSFEPAARHATCAELQTELDRAIAAESLLVSPSELGAFVTRYLGERLEARRQLISISLQSLTDGNAGAVAALAKGLPSETENTVARPGAIGAEVRSEATRVWTPSTREGSLTTNSTSVSDELRGPSPRRVWGVAAFAALTALAAMLVFWLRAAASDDDQAAAASAHVSVPPVAVPALPLTSTASAIRPAAPPPQAPDEPATGTPHVVSLESLPLTPEPKTPLSMPSKPHAVSATAHPKPKRKMVDDGF